MPPFGPDAPNDLEPSIWEARCDISNGSEHQVEIIGHTVIVIDARGDEVGRVDRRNEAFILPPHEQLVLTSPDIPHNTARFIMFGWVDYIDAFGERREQGFGQLFEVNRDPDSDILFDTRALDWELLGPAGFSRQRPTESSAGGSTSTPSGT